MSKLPKYYHYLLFFRDYVLGNKKITLFLCFVPRLITAFFAIQSARLCVNQKLKKNCKIKTNMYCFLSGFEIGMNIFPIIDRFLFIFLFFFFSLFLNLY